VGPAIIDVFWGEDVVMRILFLSRWFPYPTDNGSKIRIFNLLKALSNEYEVALISFASEPVKPTSVAAMRNICSEVEFIPHRSFRTNSLHARLGFFSATPRSMIDTFNPEMACAVERIASHMQPDIVVASQIDMIPYALMVKNVKRVMEELELAVPYDAYVNEQRPSARLRRGMTWWKLQHYLRRTLSAFDLITVVSAREQALARRVVSSSPVQVVPNGADLQAMQRVQSIPQPGTLIYSGALSFYANYDAVHYFLAEIFPLILERAPATRFLVTGSTQGVDIEKLPSCPNVEFTGYLDDVWSTVANSWVSVVPLRLGGGTRLKVIESLGLGTPVVSTSKGVEGLDLRAGVDLLIADDPRSFADATLALLDNPAQRHHLSEEGRRAVVRYDWASIGDKLNELLADVSGARQPLTGAVEAR
jgi:glycosyltransferase involved in cell wall biosynthesis